MTPGSEMWSNSHILGAYSPQKANIADETRQGQPGFGEPRPPGQKQLPVLRNMDHIQQAPKGSRGSPAEVYQEHFQDPLEANTTLACQSKFSTPSSRQVTVPQVVKRKDIRTTSRQT